MPYNVCTHLFFILDVVNVKKMAKKSYTYKPQYGIVVVCASEEEQKKLFERLQKLGLTLKVVVV